MAGAMPPMSPTFYYALLLFGLPHSREYYARCLLLLQIQDELLHPQSRIRDVQQISRDKLDGFPRATTEFTLCVLDRYGLRNHWPTRPTLTPQIRFLYIARVFAPRFLQTPPRSDALALRYHFTSIRL